jgi:hypothetical protein
MHDTWFDTETVDETPLEGVEEVLEAAQFQWERSEDGDLHFAGGSMWSELHGFFSWRDEPAAISLHASFDLKTPVSRTADVAELVSRINEAMWFGHFELWPEEGAVVFRAVVPLLGSGGSSLEAAALMLDAALESVDRFYPAFNFVLWAGKSPGEAVEAAMLETVGEA